MKLRVITIEPRTINLFRATWPCSGLSSIGHIVIAEIGGELIDIEYFDKEYTSIDEPTDSGEAISALVSAAIRCANRNPQPCRLIDTGWTY